MIIDCPHCRHTIEIKPDGSAVALEQFCMYSKRWLGFYGSRCLIGKDKCDGCVYFKEREPTEYYKRKRLDHARYLAELDGVE